MPDQPNILYILADDLGWGDVSFHGSPIRTPNLDWLAREGVELTRHYVCPVCTPTRTALLTGRHPGRFGIHATAPTNSPVLPDGYPTLASTLRDAGYDTALFGKWHLGSDPQYNPTHFGFDYCYGSLAGGVDPYNHCYKRGPHSKTWHRNGERTDERGHVTDLITDEAVRWLHDRNAQKPWFAYVPYTAVHTPIKPPQDWLRHYQTDQPYDGDPACDRSFRMYAAYTSHMDYNVGRLIEALAEREMLEDTIVVFASDNGAFPGDPQGHDAKLYPGRQEGHPRLGSNYPLRGHKGQMYEGGVRTPTLVYWPGTLAPGKVDRPVHIADWMPTLLRLAGHAPTHDPQWDGTDIWPVIDGSDDAPHDDRPLYWNLRDNSFALRRGRWKLIAHDPDMSHAHCELFDLDADPLEKHDCAPDRPEQVTQLLDALAEQRRWDHTSVREDMKPQA